MSDVPSTTTKKKNSEPAQSRGESMQTYNLQDMEKVRAELNLEKWPIWKPSHSREEHKREEIFIREKSLDDGSKEKAKVIIRASGNLDLFTTGDQKNLYVLFKLWEDAGKPLDIVPFSLHKIAKFKNKKWGQDTLNEIINSLKKLGGITFEWDHSFYDSETKETLHSVELFHILSNLKIAYRTKGDKIDCREVAYFRFHDLILKNLLNNHTKPLCFDVILSFKSEIAQLLYTYVDLIMANKTHYERRTKELFNDLNLEGEAYKNLSDRKRKLERALKEMQNILLSTGILTESYLEKTKDEKDLKVVFKKQPFQKNEEPKNKVGKKEERKTAIILPEPNKEALELAKLFHEKLGRSNYHPSSRELDQATALLAECGFDKSKHVISFALEEAKITNFLMRSFGAVFQYKSEALRTYEKQKRDFELRQSREDSLKKEEEEKRQRTQSEHEELDALYQDLTEKERVSFDTLIERRLFNHPFAKDPNSPIYQPTLQSIRYEILKEYRSNPGLLVSDHSAQDMGLRPEISRENGFSSVSLSPSTLFLLPERSQSLIIKDIQAEIS